MDKNRSIPNPLFTLKRAAPPPPLSGTDHNAYIQLVQDAWSTGLPALKRVVDLDIVQWTSMLFCWLNPHDETREEVGKQLAEALEQIVEHLDPSYDEGWERAEERPTTAIPALLCAIQMGFSSAAVAQPAPKQAPTLELVPSPRPRTRPRSAQHRILCSTDDGAGSSLGKYCLYTDEQLLKAYRMTQAGRYRFVDIARRLRMNPSYISKLGHGDNKRLARLLAEIEKSKEGETEPSSDASAAAPAAE